MNKTAKEMFEELGYEQDNSLHFMTKEVYIISYYKGDIGISFYYSDKTIGIEFIKGRITEKELQAINKQIEELGWNNE